MTNILFNEIKYLLGILSYIESYGNIFSPTTYCIDS